GRGPTRSCASSASSRGAAPPSTRTGPPAPRSRSTRPCADSAETHRRHVPMGRTTVVVIGAGRAGLAASHLLTAGSVDHVVLERGRVAERWLSQRWDSL